MLKIRAAKSPTYYERAEFARDDYYGERSQVPGQWIGAGAADLGLVGSPAQGQLGTLLEGKHPDTGEALNPRAQAVQNAGYDLTFNCAKDVSLLAALGTDEERRQVIAGHEVGVRHALAYLEANECWVRRGKAGAEKLRGAGFAGAIYHHEMSRAADPHLHTHCVISSRVRGPDGRYTAAHMRPVFLAAPAAARINEAVLRAELTRRLGVEWVRDGELWRVAGVPRALVEHFSKRFAEIEALALERGIKTAAGYDRVQRETRDHKPLVNRDQMTATWRGQARDLGFERADLEAVFNRGRDRLHGTQTLHREPTEAELGEQLFGRHGLAREASTWTRRDVIEAVADAHAGGLELGAIEALADRQIAAHAIEVASPSAKDPATYPTTYTSPGLLAAEARLVEMAERPPDVAPAPLADEAVDAVLADHAGLGADQAGAVRHLLTADGRIAVLEALAGTGKTTAVAAAVDGWRRAGVPVLGTAWSGQATQQLERDAGVRSETMARILNQVRQGREPIPAGAVVLCDEASMPGTLHLEELAYRVADRGGRLVLVGDRHQLPSIEAGGALQGLADRIGSASLDTIRRQRTELQRAVAGHLAEGRAADAIALLSEYGRLATFADATSARDQLLADWCAAGGAAAPADHLILAHDRGDVRRLNQAAREERDRDGAFGPERLIAGEREWAVGDRLLCLANDYRAAVDVRNGTRGTVVGLDLEAGALTLERDDGRGRVMLPADYLEGAVDYAYASTAHKSQGGTAEHVYLLAHPAQGGREWGYVAGSRHREDLHAYVFGPEIAGRIAEAAAERGEEAAREEERSAEAELSERVREALVEGWSRSRAKTFALDQIDPDRRAEAIAAARADLAGLDREQLAEARAGAREQVAELEKAKRREPHAARAAIDEAERQVAKAEDAAADAERRALKAEAAREELSRLRSSQTRRQLAEEAAKAREDAERHRVEAARWQARRDELASGPTSPAWEAAHPDNADRLAAATAREEELARDLGDRAGLAEQVNPSPETVRFIGPKPAEEGPLRAAWERAAQQAGAYRARYDLGADVPGIGPELEDKEQAQAWQEARAAAEPVRERAADQLDARLALERMEASERTATEALRDDLRRKIGGREQGRDLGRGLDW